MDRKIIWGITVKELLVFTGIYLFFSMLYSTTLWLSRGGFENEKDVLFSAKTLFDDSGLQYLVFLVFLVPAWYLIFRMLKKEKIVFRLLIHLVTMPLFVIGSKKMYYYLSDVLGYGHLGGTGQVWDIYIPALIYIIFFGIFHAYEHYQIARQKLKVEGELRQAALKSELAAIKAQLNPHFLYNVFNTINASVPSEQEKTRQLIATLSDLFRYQLKASKKELVPLSDELEFVNDYLELEKARFEERLDIEINVPKELLTQEIPPMLLQPLVENSVKHGISNSLKGGKISISIFRDGHKLKFEIADTGQGVKDKDSLFGKGVGLSNTQMRLQKMYQSKLEILDNEPQGLKIRFAI